MKDTLIKLLIALFMSQVALAQSDEDGAESLERFKIDGVIERPKDMRISDTEWFAATRIYTNTGYSAFLKANGSFTMHNLPWGSHFLYVSHPSTAYAPVRIDLTNKGKWRVRRINTLQPAKVEVISGPLKMMPLGKIQYFQPREQWRITDMLFSPMVLMTIVPLVLLLVLPKMSDPETRKEMEAAQMQMPKMETPELSEIFTNLFKGGAPAGGNERKSVRGGAGGPGAVGRGVRRREK